jgi:hypothetical protein
MIGTESCCRRTRQYANIQKLFLSSSSSSSDSRDSPTRTHLSTEDALDLVRFQRRQEELKRAKREQKLPPHPSLDPKEVVELTLNELRNAPYYDFDPLKPTCHPGVEMLWQTSTWNWQQTMAAAVGCGGSSSGTNTSSNNGEDDNLAIPTCTQKSIVSALGRLFARPGQQFAILVGQENANYWIDFPTDVLHWSDEECWLECRLRDAETNDLLVVLGWTLKMRECAGQSCWLVDVLDWQDFRNDYRPGIGREEWERICG